MERQAAPAEGRGPELPAEPAEPDLVGAAPDDGLADFSDLLASAALEPDLPDSVLPDSDLPDSDLPESGLAASALRCSELDPALLLARLSVR